MADDYEDDENDTIDNSDDSDSGEAIPTSATPPAPEDDTQEDFTPPPDNQYRNPMLDARRPAPGTGEGGGLISRIMQYARDTFTPVSQAVAPQPQEQEAIPTEFSPEAKKYVEAGKQMPLYDPGMLDKLTGGKINTATDLAKAVGSAFVSQRGLGEQLSYAPLPPAGPVAAGSIAEQAIQAQAAATREPEGPPIPKEILEGKLSASATTQAAIENIVDPSMQKPASLRAAEAINYTADKAGLQGGLGMLQRYRNNYNTARAFADVALENDNMESAIAAANRAYSSVPGLNNITFSQGKNGLVTAYVTDDNNHTSAYNLAPHRFKQLLGGAAGDFDSLLKNNAAGVEALGHKSDRTFNAAGQEMVAAPKIIFPKTEKEREFDRKQAADEEAATTAHERQKELIKARGDEAERRERVKTEGIRGTKEEQDASRERIAEANRLAKNKSLDDQMKQAVNKMLADGKSQREIALYKKRFMEENGMAPVQAPPQKPPANVRGFWGEDASGKVHWYPQ